MSAVRNTLNAVRYDWRGLRIGGGEASMSGLWPALIVLLLVVFACFFAIGRLFVGDSSQSEASSAAPVVKAAIPSALQGSSPIAGPVPSSVTEPPPRPKPVPVRHTQAPRAASPSTLGGESSSGTSLESAPAVEAAPTEAPVPPPSSSGGSGSSGGGSARGGGSGGSGSGGGSFDTSE
ncbi:MAG TPA: hypothetical protein VN672_07755 [Solirubrobacteraceae bacterium]|nr:hypothetical protein [Solirubrobacteraceae bacterium]